jgi:hypothetical protein
MSRLASGGAATAMSGEWNSGSVTRPGATTYPQAHVIAVALQVHDLLRSVQVQRDAGLQALPTWQPWHQPALREGGQGSHAQRLCRLAMRLRGGQHAGLQLREHLVHRPLQCLPGGVQHQPPPLAREELEAQRGLQPADLLADGAVRQVQALGRGAQVRSLCRGAEGGEVVQRKTV